MVHKKKISEQIKNMASKIQKLHSTIFCPSLHKFQIAFVNDDCHENELWEYIQMFSINETNLARSFLVQKAKSDLGVKHTVIGQIKSVSQHITHPTSSSEPLPCSFATSICASVWWQCFQTDEHHHEGSLHVSKKTKIQQSNRKCIKLKARKTTKWNQSFLKKIDKSVQSW